MDKQQIIDYVLDTPTNTNPRILGQMLDEYAAEGGGSGGESLIVRPTSQGSAGCDKTWQEVSDAYKAGLPIYLQISPNGSVGSRQQLERIKEPILGSGEYKVQFAQLTTTPQSMYTDLVADSADGYLYAPDFDSIG